MNFLFVLLLTQIFSIFNGYSVPSANAEDKRFWDETTEDVELATSITSTTSTSTSTTSTTSTTTTTTTAAPEVDREWEDQILSGPTLANYFGLLMTLASTKNQQLKVPSNFTANYLRNTFSLSATLEQISSNMYQTLQKLQDDLIRIRYNMVLIPEHMKAALFSIQTIPYNQLNTLLTYTIRNIEREASESFILAKPILENITSINLLIEEFLIYIEYVSQSSDESSFFLEVQAYTVDIKNQLNILTQFFDKFSRRVFFTIDVITTQFSAIITQAQAENGFISTQSRITQLRRIIPAAIAIDQSVYLLNMTTNVYDYVSKDLMLKQIDSNKQYITLSNLISRATVQRQLWKNIISQSIIIVRLAHTRHSEFAETTLPRQAEYDAYLTLPIS